MKRILLSLLGILFLFQMAEAQYKFKPAQLIVPVTFIGIGIIGLESDWLKYQNREMRDELQENINRKITVDDFSQYVPMATVYALNLCVCIIIVIGLTMFWRVPV